MSLRATCGEEPEGRELTRVRRSWGKDEKGADLVDVTDRLGFLVFKTAELQEAHALRLEQSRQALKDIVRSPSASHSPRTNTPVDSATSRTSSFPSVRNASPSLRSSRRSRRLTPHPTRARPASSPK